ncbi:MAG: hypothetical protein VX664_13290, partial [Chloroflexota bacterium]|nr:hypothetical protein [Chloroflexota bacterium]
TRPASRWPTPRCTDHGTTQGHSVSLDEFGLSGVGQVRNLPLRTSPSCPLAAPKGEEIHYATHPAWHQIE